MKKPKTTIDAFFASPAIKKYMKAQIIRSVDLATPLLSYLLAPDKKAELLRQKKARNKLKRLLGK